MEETTLLQQVVCAVCGCRVSLVGSSFSCGYHWGWDVSTGVRSRSLGLRLFSCGCRWWWDVSTGVGQNEKQLDSVPTIRTAGSDSCSIFSTIKFYREPLSSPRDENWEIWLANFNKITTLLLWILLLCKVSYACRKCGVLPSHKTRISTQTIETVLTKSTHTEASKPSEVVPRQWTKRIQSVQSPAENWKPFWTRKIMGLLPSSLKSCVMNGFQLSRTLYADGSHCDR